MKINSKSDARERHLIQMFKKLCKNLFLSEPYALLISNQRANVRQLSFRCDSEITFSKTARSKFLWGKATLLFLNAGRVLRTPAL